MIVLNFSHPLSESARSSLAELYGSVQEDRRTAQFDLNKPLAPQIEPLLSDLPSEFVLVPPALAHTAILMVERLTVRTGTRPPIVRLSPVGLPPVFVLAEVI